MSERPTAPVVLDSTVLSNFASSGAVPVLVTALPKTVTTPVIRDELEHGAKDGYAFLEQALAELGDTIPVVEPVQPVDNAIAVALDAGEAEALHVARTRGGTLATDDRDARAVAREFDVPVTGSLGVLVQAVVTGRIEQTTADAWLTNWQQKHGYRSPVDSIEALLD